MATSGEKRWPRMGRNRWPLTLDPADIAQHFGHQDGGELVRKLYGHFDQMRARNRVREAFNGAPVCQFRSPLSRRQHERGELPRRADLQDRDRQQGSPPCPRVRHGTGLAVCAQRNKAMANHDVTLTATPRVGQISQTYVVWGASSATSAPID